MNWLKNISSYKNFKKNKALLLWLLLSLLFEKSQSDCWYKDFWWIIEIFNCLQFENYCFLSLLAKYCISVFCFRLLIVAGTQWLSYIAFSTNFLSPYLIHAFGKYFTWTCCHLQFFAIFRCVKSIKLQTINIPRKVSQNFLKMNTQWCICHLLKIFFRKLLSCLNLIWMMNVVS